MNQETAGPYSSLGSTGSSTVRVRKPRGCLDAIAPLFVLACLILSNYCFFLLERPRGSPLVWYNYIYIVLYEVIVILVLWCLLRLVFSDPGYIEKGYRYDIGALSALD